VTAVTGYAARPLPAEGAWRVHPDPAALPQLSHEGSGRNRYDDPNGQSTVRYAAQNLTGALLETMARFRPNPEAERLLAQVAGIEDSDVEHADPTVGVADWLATQRVGRVHVAGDATLVDVHDPDLLRDMDKHPLVRAALEESGLGTALNPARLDQAVVRLGGPVGRPITQALSAAIRDWRPEIAASPTCRDSMTRNGAGHCGTPPSSQSKRAPSTPTSGTTAEQPSTSPPRSRSAYRTTGPDPGTRYTRSAPSGRLSRDGTPLSVLERLRRLAPTLP
jgi:hypothetical protein